MRLDDEHPSPWPEYSKTMVAQARKRVETKRSRSQQSAEHIYSDSASTRSVMQANILSSVKRTRARRDNLHLNKYSKQ